MADYSLTIAEIQAKIAEMHRLLDEIMHHRRAAQDFAEQELAYCTHDAARPTTLH